jgi:hypothetical protein
MIVDALALIALVLAVAAPPIALVLWRADRPPRFPAPFSTLGLRSRFLRENLRRVSVAPV